jgi:carbonic anhydrase/acetyltransferase-like protein (isoleucine patch superfamily)
VLNDARFTIVQGAILNGCTIEDSAFVGMRATVQQGAVVKTGAFVSAGAVVPAGTTVPSGVSCSF